MTRVPRICRVQQGARRTLQGRPPFDLPNIVCYLSQYTNAIYVMNGDLANTTDVYTYTATAELWSAQATNTTPAHPLHPPSIRIISGLSSTLTPTSFTPTPIKTSSHSTWAPKTGTSTPIPWTSVQNPEFGDAYNSVMAFAPNHIHFLDVFGVPAGSVKTFYNRCGSHMQPDAQRYGNFPAVHGCTWSFFWIPVQQ